MLNAARDGLGLAYLPEEMVLPDIAKGNLQRVLDDWCPPYPGYHRYYPSRRQPQAAFALLVDALRYTATRQIMRSRGPPTTCWREPRLPHPS